MTQHSPGPAVARPQGAPKRRIQALDGVRGLAALSVALGHCVLVVFGLDIWSKTIFDFPTMSADKIVGRLLSIAFPSDAAVMVFFVLSGHVLWRGFVRDKQTIVDLPDYLCSRIFRLMPLIIVTVIPYGYFGDATFKELLANMFLVSTSLNGVLWSLQVEMAGSIVIFAVWLLSRGQPLKVFSALLVLTALVPFFRGNPFVVYLPAFVLGALIREVPNRVWQSRALLWCALGVLIFTNLILSHGGVARCFEIVAAMAVIGCVGTVRPAWLEMPVTNFLGAISYPFYLVHPLGVYGAAAIIRMLPQASAVTEVLLYAIFSLAISIPLAWFLHVTIEYPALKSRPRLRPKLADAPP